MALQSRASAKPHGIAIQSICKILYHCPAQSAYAPIFSSNIHCRTHLFILKQNKTLVNDNFANNSTTPAVKSSEKNQLPAATPDSNGSNARRQQTTSGRQPQMAAGGSDSDARQQQPTSGRQPQMAAGGNGSNARRQFDAKENIPQLKAGGCFKESEKSMN